MNYKPNLIKVAVEAAGGRTVVSRAFGMDVWSITNWQRTNRVPAHHIRQLCAMGDNIITPERLLAYIEEHAAARGEQAAA